MVRLSIGERIRDLRTERGMTQKDLADKLGISYVGVSQWESGSRNPKYSTLQKIAAALDTPVAFLLGLESNPDGKVTSDTRRKEVANVVEKPPLEFTINVGGMVIEDVLTLVDKIREKYPDAKIHVNMGS